MKAESEKFSISADKAKLDLPYIHQFLSQSYWAENIPVEVVQRSIDGSLCFGVYDDNRQIGFARVVTDTATFGYLADVFIDERYRGLGLSGKLMETIMAHPDLQGFRSWHLVTRDAQGLYAKFGFTPLDNPERVMRKYNAGVYKNKV